LKRTIQIATNANRACQNQKRHLWIESERECVCVCIVIQSDALLLWKINNLFVLSFSIVNNERDFQ